MEYIIGNLCSLGAMVTDTISSSCKSARKMLLVQILSQFFYGFGAIVLKGYSAAVQNAVAVLRNLAAIRNIQSKWVEWGLILLGVVLGLCFNNLGWLGLLPVIANLVYSLTIFRFPDNELALKAAFIINLLLFTVFNVAILNIVGALTNGVLAVSTTLFLIRDIRRVKNA